jgi:23S rRNA (uracil1939-C5)-methyltransferase
MEYPVKKGQRMELKIERTGGAGCGVAVVEGLAVLVEGALDGELVEAEIVKTQPRYALAKALRVREAAPGRAVPPCPVYEQCGGCRTQFMDYAAHLMQIEEDVRQAFRRVAGLVDFELLPPLGMETPWRYRNKAVYRAGETPDGPRLGFVARGSHDLVAATDCLLQSGEAQTAARVVEAWMRAERVAPYDERAGRGLVRHLCVRTNRKGETMVVVVATREKLPGEAALIRGLRDALPGLRSAVVNVNTRRTQEILGGKNRLLYGQERLEEALMGLKFRLSPLSFFQVNTLQAERLYQQAAEFAGLGGGETVADAYCGAGAIGMVLARRARRVVGIEIVADAVRDARDNARENGIENIEFLEGACEDVLPREVARGLRPDVVVLDPPRRGCEEAVLRAAAESGPARIVYVSCNAATLARDAGRLAGMGYAVKKARPVDMFPWTGEVETVCLLSKLPAK